MSNKHREQRKDYRPTFADFFPKTPRGGTARDRSADGEGRQKNIDDWNEERSSGGARSAFSIAVEKRAA